MPATLWYAVRFHVVALVRGTLSRARNAGEESGDSPAIAGLDPAAALPALAAYIGSAVLVAGGLRLWQETDASMHDLSLWTSILSVAFGLFLAVYGSLPGIKPSHKENAAVGALVFAFVSYAGLWLLYRTTSAYGSDALLFNVYSAQIAAAGGNPYTHSMEPAFALFNSPRALITPTAGGGAIFLQSYPALSFLIYIPFLWMGINPLWINVALQLGLLAVIIWVAPRPLKAIAPLVLFVDHSYVDYTLGGVTDIMWVLPLALCARYWNSRPVLAAIYLGIACDMKQQPWFVALFAVTGWALWAWEDRNLRRLVAPLAALLLSFFLPNLPYIAMDHATWVRGVLIPFQGHLLAFGVGAMQLVSANVYATDIQTLTRLSGLVLVLLLAVYAVDRRKMAFLPFLAPGIALLFATRELQNYFMWWPAVVAVFSLAPREAAQPEPTPTRRSRLQLAPIAAGLVAAMLFGVVATRGATGSVNRVQVALVHAEYDPDSGDVTAFVVRAKNHADVPRSVRFGILLQGNGDDFYYWVQKPQTFGPGEERIVHVEAPSSGARVRAVHETAQVVAVDAASGTQTYSEPQRLLAFFGGLDNPNLDQWQDGRAVMPVDWDYSASDVANGYFARGRGVDRSSLAFDVPPPIDEPLRTVAVEQRFTGAFRRFVVRLRPWTPFAGQPTTLFGVQMTDALGHRAYYTIDGGAHATQILRDGLGTIFAVPGKVGVWNEVAIDADQLIDDAAFELSESQPLSIAIVGIVQHGVSQSVRGDFGGISSR